MQFLSRKICIIDDEPLLCEILKEYLNMNFEVDIYQDSKSAPLAKNFYDYDLYLCDVIMPDTDGVELLKMVTSRNDKAFFVFMTGSIDLDKSFMQLVDNQRVHILNKPFDSLEQVRDLISNLLQR